MTVVNKVPLSGSSSVSDVVREAPDVVVQVLLECLLKFLGLVNFVLLPVGRVELQCDDVVGWE